MPQVAIERTGAIAICRLDPPDGFMNEATVTELDRATAELAADAAVRAVVFTGAQPGVFIRHYDVRELERLGRSLRKRGARFGRERPLKDRPIDVVLRRLGEMPKPAIAAINGFAMGGGFEFCLACDLRIAQEGDSSSACRRSSSASCRGRGARSAWQGWWGRPARWSWRCAAAR